jgi:hypothetical protein
MRFLHLLFILAPSRIMLLLRRIIQTHTVTLTIRGLWYQRVERSLRHNHHGVERTKTTNSTTCSTSLDASWERYLELYPPSAEALPEKNPQEEHLDVLG